MVKFEEKREWIGGQANTSNTLFENHRKSLILRLYERIHFDRTKVHKNANAYRFENTINFRNNAYNILDME